MHLYHFSTSSADRLFTNPYIGLCYQEDIGDSSGAKHGLHRFTIGLLSSCDLCILSGMATKDLIYRLPRHNDLAQFYVNLNQFIQA